MVRQDLEAGRDRIGGVAPEEVIALGFMLGDKKARAFKLEIESIKVKRAAK